MKKKKKLKNFHYYFFKNLIILNKKFPKTCFSIFKIYFGNFSLLDIDFKKSRGNKDFEYSSKLEIIYTFKYFEKFEDEKFIKKKILQYINIEKDYLKSLITKYSVEQKVSDFKLFKKVSNILDLKNKKIYLKKYKQNILGTNLYAYGHLINLVDIMHRKKKLNLNDNKKIVISPNYVANSCLANYLVEKYKKNCVIDHNLFVKSLYDRKALSQDLINLEEIDKPHSLYQLPYKEYIKYKNVSCSINNNVFNKVIEKKNIKLFKLNEPYTAIIIRDKNYKSYDKNLNVNEDRFSNPIYILKIIKLVNYYGFKAVLINGNLHEGFNKKEVNYFDYSNSNLRNDYNDLSIFKNCSFSIRLGTSSSALNLLFNKFQLNLNYPLNRKPIFHDKSYYLPKKIFFKNKLISNSNYFNNDLYINHDYKILMNKGYELIDNEWEEAKEAFHIFYNDFSKNKPSLKKNVSNEFYYPLNIIDI